MERLKFEDQSDLRQLTHLSTPVWIFDADKHNIWWANDQGIAFWKAGSLAELKTRDFSGDSATVRDRLLQIVELASHETRVSDTWTLYPDGVPQTVVLSFQPVKIAGNANGILIELLQILERDADNETWRLLEAARATSLSITTFSLEGRVLAQNPAALACYGSERASSNGQSDLQARFALPENAQRVLDGTMANSTESWEAVMRTQAGLRTHMVAIRKGRDPITGEFVIVVSEEDVTAQARLRARQESEKAALKSAVAESSDKLRISQERYALAVQTAAIWDWDVQADRLFLSPNFVNALGYEKEEFRHVLSQLGLESIVHPDDVDEYHEKLSAHLFQHDQPMSHEMRFLTKDENVRWYHCQGNCVYDADGTVLRSVGLLTDITHRKELEVTLLASQRMEAIGQLTGGLAHDFNNLLTVIQGNAELLEELGAGEPELTNAIKSAAERGAALTRHLLAFAKQQTLIPKHVDLNVTIPHIKGTLLRAISETVEISYDAPSGLWPVYADPTQIETAVLNLALNARDAMPKGGKMHISCSNLGSDEVSSLADLQLEPGDYVEISVRDEGRGMSAETLQKAFEPFFTTKGVGQGSGLGLSMVLGFSRQSRGDARIVSAPGEGTSVVFYLPRATEMEKEVEVSAKAPTLSGNCEHIHVLEDNPHVLETVSRTISSLGYIVSSSATAEDALAYAKQTPEVSLYLVDVLLPGTQSGVDFARSLKTLRKDARILFMSGYPESELMAASAGDFVLISKPFDKASISKAINDVMFAEV
ncbi:MAG: ATP-binding protein [Pseudomonadota bacterium]